MYLHYFELRILMGKNGKLKVVMKVLLARWQPFEIIFGEWYWMGIVFPPLSKVDAFYEGENDKDCVV
jgi:hypothetical protein